MYQSLFSQMGVDAKARDAAAAELQPLTDEIVVLPADVQAERRVERLRLREVDTPIVRESADDENQRRLRASDEDFRRRSKPKKYQTSESLAL